MQGLDSLRSIAGYPKHFASSVRYEGKNLMMEDGDLVIEDGDLLLVEGAAGVGQSIAHSLSAYFADLERYLVSVLPESVARDLQQTRCRCVNTPRS